MEESLYYPLFVLSCWLCFRLLTKGTAREALACSAAVCVTYFAKPLVVPLIFAYTFAVAVWFVLESRRGDGVRERLGQLGLRLTPILALALALYLRHAIVAAGTAPQSASELLLSRTYSGETSGPSHP
jgi:predicted PurR-regulated permease PerM